MANWNALTVISFSIGLVGLIVIIVLYTATGGNVPFDYGIVLEADSSHTQVTLYNWLGSKNRGTGVVEQVDTCKVEGGISSYNISNVDSIGYDLLNCVYNVSKNIDKNRLFLTPLYLGATAGMRLLNITDPLSTKIILTLIGDVFKLNTGLQIKIIDIISGQKEGLFSWVTNNYLSDKLIVDKFDEFDTNSTIGMLDMGGASVQIAYRTGNKPNSSVDEVNDRLYGINHTVRSSSNLCFGVDTAMLRYQKYLILNWNKSRSDEKIDNPCLPRGREVVISGNVFRNQFCVKSKDKTKEVDFNRNYTFVGKSDANHCSDIINSEIMNKTNCEQNYEMCFEVSKSRPPESRQFYAISAYYYTARVLNLSQPLSANEYKEKTTKFCNSDNNTIHTDWPLIIEKYVDVYCFQLNFIYTTINTVYRFDDNMWPNIIFSNKIRKTDLGWGLGFMIDATNAIAAENATPPIVELFPLILVIIICTL